MAAQTERSGGATFVIGPSHGLRWHRHVRDGVVPCDLPSGSIFGVAGAPIWSKRLFETARQHVEKGDSIAVMVGDFRFGNSIGLAPDQEQGPLFQDGFVGIDQRAMVPQIDAGMQERGLAGVQSWLDAFGGKARFIFWDLFGRQVFDRLAGRHIRDGRYHHPVYNYSDTVGRFGNADIVDLSPLLLRKPMHEVGRLFIDPSLHPSRIGYLFLNDVLCKGRGVTEAFDQAIAAVEADLFALARQISGAKGGPVLIAGRSIWLKTLAGYLGMNGLIRLAREGLVVVPLEPVLGALNRQKLLDEVPLDRCTCVVVSAEGRDLSAQLARAFHTSATFWRNVPCVDWENATVPAITARGGTPHRIAAGSTEPLAADLVTPDLAAHMVEQGPSGTPSWTGIIHLLGQLKTRPILAPRPSFRQTASAPSIERIEGNALLTDAGIAFLIGGNHSVLKFATGELTPSQRSIDTFRKNILSRSRIAKAVGARYAHVIFPDKQSVLIEAFPHQPVHRLGEIYLRRFEADEIPLVLYPAEDLRRSPVSAFLPFDTHLTDHGSVEVLRMILDRLGIDAPATLAHLSRSITRTQNWTGDLGKQFTPPLFQETTVLDPDWRIIELRSSGGFNDGMIDLLFNAEATVDGTLLLFGDSFLRFMLKHLSAVFSKVVHLRSRFLHPEMVTLISPEYIVTGNAERYLSDVTPDDEAHPFSLYTDLRGGVPLPLGDDFLAGWRAVTAPKSSFAASYWKSHGFPAFRPAKIGAKEACIVLAHASRASG